MIEPVHGDLVRHCTNGLEGVVVEVHFAKRPRGPGVVVDVGDERHLWEAGEYEVLPAETGPK